MSRHDTDLRSAAESIFASFLCGSGSGATPDIDVLVAAHPEHATALRELWSYHRDAKDMNQRAFELPRPPAKPTLREEGPVRSLLRRLSERHDPSKRYERGQALGEGGFGEVFEVRDTDLERTLAMKVIRREPSSATTEGPDPQRLARFLEEAQITGQLDHPGVVPIHEVGVTGDGQVYYTMRVVQGDNLHKVFEVLRAGGAGRTLTGCIDILARVCETMAFVHAKKGVIHRDLKPANVMVGEFGEVYVMDWGLARWLDRDAPSTPATVSDEVRTVRRAELRQSPDAPVNSAGSPGTPEFMSPEQARDDRNAIGPQTDVYSVGAMLYQLLSGRVPYRREGARQATDVERLARVIAGPPDALDRVAPDAPAELIAICERAMERDIAKRYATMAELRDDLRAFIDRRVVRAYETGAWAEARKWVVRNRALSVAIGLCMLAAVAAAALQFTRLTERSERQVAELAAQRQQSIAEQVRMADSSASRAAWNEVLISVDRALELGYDGRVDALCRRLEAATALMDVPQAEAAMGELQSVADLGSHRGRAQVLRAAYLSQAVGRAEECFEAARAAIDAGVQGADLEFAEALVAPTTKGALARLDRALNLAPFHRAAHDLRASLLFFSGMNREAEQAARLYVSLYPDDSIAQLRLALTRAALGEEVSTSSLAGKGVPENLIEEFALAKQTIDVLRRISPDTWTGVGGAIPMELLMLGQKAKLRTNSRDVRLAAPSLASVSAFGEALAVGMNQPGGQSLTAALQAVVLRINTEPLVVAAAIEKALEHHEDAVLYYLLACIRISTPDRPPADEVTLRLRVRDWFIKALETPSFIPGIHRAAVFWLCAAENYIVLEYGKAEFKDSVLARCRQYYAFEDLTVPESRAYSNTALSFEELDLAAAIAHRTVQTHPDDWDAKLAQAHVMTRCKRFSEAINIYEKLLALDPSAERNKMKRRALLKRQEEATPMLADASRARSKWIEAERTGGDREK